MVIYIYQCELDQNIIIAKVDHGKSWCPGPDDDVYDLLGKFDLTKCNSVSIWAKDGYAVETEVK